MPCPGSPGNAWIANLGLGLRQVGPALQNAVVEDGGRDEIDCDMPRSLRRPLIEARRQHTVDLLHALRRAGVFASESSRGETPILAHVEVVTP